jgi:type I restriction-modification system DNA methylase subunit
VVRANPPFGRKSSVTMVGADGRESRDDLEIVRGDFWVTTSNKQLNFVQHIKTILDINGRATVALPDGVLFEVAPARRSAAACCRSSTSTPCCVCRPGSSTPAG